MKLERPLAGWTSLALPDDELVQLFVDVAATEARVEEVPRLMSLVRRALACVAMLESGEEDEVTNTAFVVKGELRRRREQLAAAQGTDCEWSPRIAAEGARRGLLRATTALERALANRDGREPRFTDESELKAAIEARTVYAQLQALLGELGEPSAEQTCVGLCTVLELLDGLISRPSFEQLRAGDRRQFHEFHDRVSAWLAQPVDERAGQYLWQDFAGFVQMLRAVNHRQELVELTRVAAALA